MNQALASQRFLELVEIMDTLREKCPWDQKQTIHSLRSNTIEELYELVDSIVEEDWDGIKEELGDIMLHVLFYAKIGFETLSQISVLFLTESPSISAVIK